jgi:DNA-directed RNA polymerase beta subunit
MTAFIGSYIGLTVALLHACLCAHHQIRTTLPYVRTDVPVVLIFRALGFVNDKTILEHIVYDFR